MAKKNKEKDYFGFSNDYQYDRNIDYPVANGIMHYSSTILLVLGIIILVIAILMYGFSGYIAWNSVTNDPLWIKSFKTFLAMLFSPVYLFYIFVRTIIFKLPN